MGWTSHITYSTIQKLVEHGNWSASLEDRTQFSKLWYMHGINTILYIAVPPAGRVHWSRNKELEAQVASFKSFPVTTWGFAFPIPLVLGSLSLEVLVPKGETLLTGDTAKIPLNYKLRLPSGHFRVRGKKSNHCPGRGNRPWWSGAGVWCTVRMERICLTPTLFSWVPLVLIHLTVTVNGQMQQS